ncbi:MAG: alpha/beta hydrolase [Ignavibacteriaceae bacterium]|jgi:proline iminopeptidase
MKIHFVFLHICLLLFSVTYIYSQPKEIKEFEGVKRINGTEIFCKVVGKGKPIIIVHGGPGLAHDYLFEPFKQLANSYTLIFFDQRGCGRSAEFYDADTIKMSDLVEDLEGVRNIFNIDKMILAGQSWGALVSIEYASKYPGNVSKLLLLEPAPGSTKYLGEFQNTIMQRLSKADKEKISQLAQNPELKFNPILFKEFMTTRFKGYSTDTMFLAQMHMDYFDSLRVKKFFASSAEFGSYLLNFDLYDKMKSIDTPTLIIHGQNDPIPASSIEKMSGAINSSELHIINGCGHFVHIEKPDEYFSLIRYFLSKE